MSALSLSSTSHNSELDRLNRFLPQTLMSLICTYLPMPYPEGDFYDGEYCKGKFHGKGIYMWKDGRMYEGEWKDGKRHGKGIMTYVNGDKYDGEYKDNKRNGYGILTWDYSHLLETMTEDEAWDNDIIDGRFKYVGYWENNKKNGYGVETWRIGLDDDPRRDGSDYEGEWKDGKMHGYGMYSTMIDGTIEIGKYIDGERHGTFWTRSGNWTKNPNICPRSGFWEGNMKHNKRNGIGIITTWGGDKYCGYLQNGDCKEENYTKI